MVWVERVSAMLTNAPIEFLNAKQKVLTPGRTHGWLGFASKSLCSYASEVHTRERQEMERAYQSWAVEKAVLTESKSTTPSQGRRPRAECLKQCFQKLYNARLRATNPSRKFRATDGWDDVNALWPNLADDNPMLIQARYNCAFSLAKARQERQDQAREAGRVSIPAASPRDQEQPGDGDLTLVPHAGFVSSQMPSTSAHNLELLSEDADHAAVLGVTPEVARGVAQSEWPVTIADCGNAQGSMNDRVNELRETFGRVAHGKQDFGKVKYSSRCEGCCMLGFPNGSDALKQFFFKKLEKLLKRSGKPRRSLLSVVLMKEDGGERRRQLWYITGWSATGAQNNTFKCGLLQVRIVLGAERDRVMLFYESPTSALLNTQGALFQYPRREEGVIEFAGTDKVCSPAFGNPFASCNTHAAFDHKDQDELIGILFPYYEQSYGKGTLATSRFEISLLKYTDCPF
jgi:hypothetical protein